LSRSTFTASLPATAKPSKSCKIIGIGGAGCNFIEACEGTGILLAASEWTLELVGLTSHRDALSEFIVTFSAWLFDADAVVLVAGLGGETGSRFIPVMTRLVRDSGVFVATAAILPFDWEGNSRTQRANVALQLVAQDGGEVLRFSNQELMDSLGEHITQTEFFEAQDQRIRDGIARMLDRHRFG
jgi:cell division GTPase FtsZ